MASRFDQAHALVRDARKKLAAVRKSYEKSLHEKTIDADLQVGIKGVIDHLRSALDYVAYELGEKHGSSTSESRVYFPIARKGAKEADFHSLVGRNIPGLASNRPDLVDVLKSFQAFASGTNSWLPDLATLAVENKHRNLTPQTRTECSQINVAANDGNGSVTWDPNGVHFDYGVSIMGVPIDPRTQRPVPSPTETVTHKIWVSFIFDSVQQPVLPFLKQAIGGVECIVKDLESRT